MRKFRNKFAAIVAAAMTGVMTFGLVATAAPVVSAYAEGAKVISVQVSGDDVVAPGGTVTYVDRVVTDKKGDTPEVAWTLEGAKDTDTKIDGGELTVSAKETAEKLTVKATCGGVTASLEVIVGTGASLKIDYSNMTATIKTNGDDSFLALEVLKDEKGAKAGTVYWYEKNKLTNNVTVDLSFLKLSKTGWIRVFGNENSDPLKIYTVSPQTKKPSVKYVAGKDTFADSFTLKDATLENLQYKTLYGEYWSEFSDLEEELDNLTVTGTTLLVRAVDADWDAPASTEVKVKIAACPKAPKVTVDYAKNIIKLPKTSEIRVPGWMIPEVVGTGDDKEVVDTPFYYTVEDFTVAPNVLAEKLVTKYFTEYNSAVGKLGDLQGDYETKTTEDKETDGVIKKSDKTLKLEEMAEGYGILVRTEKGKKAASQPTFVDVKAAPEIQIRQKTTGEGDNAVTVDENVIAVMTTKEVTKEDGTKEVVEDYSANTLTFDWKEEGLVLTPSGTASFSYSLDGGTKFTVVKSATTVKLAKIDSAKGVIVRTEGTKEDAKKNIIGNWASNTITLPVGVGTITISGDKEITADGIDDVPKTYTVVVKDTFGNEIKDAKVTWSATGTSENVIFDAATQKLTVKSGATAGKVTITVTSGGKTGTLEVEIKPVPAP